MWKPLVLCLLLSLSFVSAAQDEDETLLLLGEVVSGEINNAAPRVVYAVDVLRCDFLSIRLRTTSGNLDPILTVLDTDGNAIVTRDDSDGSLDIAIEPVSIPASGRYLIVVGRFGYGLGTTSGSFELAIDRIGNGSAHGCALRYGDTVYNGITNTDPRVIYSFRAQQGDIINIAMERRTGDLDPRLEVADNAGFLLAEIDDVFGTTDAYIDALLIPHDGIYYIIASRYGEETGTSTGNFVLMLEESRESGLGNSSRAAIPIRFGSTVEGTLTNTRYEQYYRFEANQNDIITVRMNRQSDTIDAYLVITNAALQELTFNDDSNGSQNATIEDFLIPADGTYYILATRFEREDGVTTGRYSLQVESGGNAFDSVPANIRRINYGVTVTGTIDDVTPDVLYAFWGNEGDKVTVALNRADGDLDPVVSIVAEDRVSVYLSDDDGGNGQNALIDEFNVPSTGIYYIRAERYRGRDNPNTSGSYVLTFAQRFDE